MINRKTIFYVMFVIIAIILIYNYAINPLLIQSSNNNTGMHMGMNRNYYNNYNSYEEFIYFLVIFFVVIGFLLIAELIFQKHKINRCSKCGYKIEDIRWHRCPICGNSLDEKRK